MLSDSPFPFLGFKSAWTFFLYLFSYKTAYRLIGSSSDLSNEGWKMRVLGVVSGVTSY